MNNEPRVYLDTSAYLGILLGEKLARNAPKKIAHKILCSSVLLLLEAERNLVRLSREDILSARDYTLALEQFKKDKELFLLKEVTIDLCLTGHFPPVRIPKTGDLIHLRTAKWFSQEGGLEGFLTFDESQKASAIDFGLPIISIS